MPHPSYEPSPYPLHPANAYPRVHPHGHTIHPTFDQTYPGIPAGAPTPLLSSLLSTYNPYTRSYGPTPTMTQTVFNAPPLNTPTAKPTSSSTATASTHSHIDGCSGHHQCGCLPPRTVVYAPTLSQTPTTMTGMMICLYNMSKLFFFPM